MCFVLFLAFTQEGWLEVLNTTVNPQAIQIYNERASTGFKYRTADPNTTYYLSYTTTFKITPVSEWQVLPHRIRIDDRRD